MIYCCIRKCKSDVFKYGHHAPLSGQLVPVVCTKRVWALVLSLLHTPQLAISTS